MKISMRLKVQETVSKLTALQKLNKKLLECSSFCCSSFFLDKLLVYIGFTVSSF